MNALSLNLKSSQIRNQRIDYLITGIVTKKDIGFIKTDVDWLV